jgi:5-methylcytosine-specific restriction protein A
MWFDAPGGVASVGAAREQRFPLAHSFPCGYNSALVGAHNKNIRACGWPCRSAKASPHDCNAMANQEHTRIRGRRAVVLRQRRIRAEPLCRDCRDQGRTALATVPDHIIPLAQGGVEDGLVVSPNIRCLCAPCHDKRTREQFDQRAPRKRIGSDGWPID